MLSFKFIFGLVALSCRGSFAIPSIRFPIDAQLPPVAVIGHPFLFTFSPTTFSSPLSLEYSVEGLPLWLELEAAHRTLAGTPEQTDVGNFEFSLIATDHEGNVSIQVHLVVLEKSSVRADQDAFTEQLSRSGMLSTPNTLLLYPEAFFNLDLSQDIFHSDGAKLDIYARSEDQAPLPAWVMFDENSNILSGTSPNLLTVGSSPQIFNFCLSASQIPNFSQSALYFDIAVTNHKLYFISTFQKVNVTAGSLILMPPLINQLQYDAEPATRNQLTTILSTHPEWLTFEQKGLSYHGTAPANFNETTFQLQVTDQMNNVAIVEVLLSTSSSETKNLTHVDLGNLIVSIGEWFSYTMVDASTGPDEPHTEIDVDFGLTAPWLNFVRTNASIQGFVPTNPIGDSVNVSATVIDEGRTVEVLQLCLILRDAPQNATGVNSGSGTGTTQPKPPTLGAPEAGSHGTHEKDWKKHLTLIIAIPIVLAVLVCLATILLLKRLRRVKTERPSPNQWMQQRVQRPNSGDIVILGDDGFHGQEETRSPAPPLAPQLTIPWAQARPPTRRPWPSAGSRNSAHSQKRSSLDVALREVQNSYGQFGHDESKQTRSSTSNVTETSTDRSLSLGNTEDDEVPEDLLTSLAFPERKFCSQLGPDSRITSSSGFDGRRMSGLGHGTSTSASMLQHQCPTLRQVSLSPLSEAPDAVSTKPALDLIDEPFMSRFRGSSSKQSTINILGVNMGSHRMRSISIGSSGYNELQEQQAHGTNQRSRKRTSSTPFSGSLWEDIDYTTEDSASRTGNWRIQGPSYSTSQISSRFGREDSAISRRWSDEPANGEVGLTSNAISTRSQQTHESHSNSLRFI